VTGFLAELGRKLAERWFTLLVLPGLAYLLVAAAAFRLGQSGWHDGRALWDGFTALTEGDDQDALVVRAILVVLAAVPVSAALGAVAQALAGPVERVLCGPWPRPFAGLSARRTRRRADAWTTEDTPPASATVCTPPTYACARSTASTSPPSGRVSGSCSRPPPATPSPRPAPAWTRRSPWAAGRSCISRSPCGGGRPR
jgi:hypothetical protein